MTKLEWFKANKPTNVAICKSCGKEGYFERIPSGYNTSRSVLQHSCTTYNDKRKAEKRAKVQKIIQRAIKDNQIPSLTGWDYSRALYEAFPYTEIDWFTLSDEERLHQLAYKTLTSKYIEYIKEKDKLPSKSTVMRFIKELKNEIKAKVSA